MIRNSSSIPARRTLWATTTRSLASLSPGQPRSRRWLPFRSKTNSVTGEDSQPVNPLTITSASLSSTSPDGVVILDTTQAKAGETATITVTATDPTDGTTATQSFNVEVGPYSGPTTAAQIGNVNFKPFANPVSATAYQNVPTQIQLAGQSDYPVASTTVPLNYTLISLPSHGSVTNFNASTGTFTYTPQAGYLGTDTFQYQVTANGPNTAAAGATSDPATVTVGVSTAPPVVSVQNTELTTNNKHMVTQVDVTFSGQVNATEADNTRIYQLAYPDKTGSYTSKKAVVVKLRSAKYDAANDSVILTPRKPFALKARPLQLLIDGTSPSGLQDIVGRYLDGADNGQAGSDAVVSISKSGVNID